MISLTVLVAVSFFSGMIGALIIFWNKSRPKIYEMDSDKWIIIKSNSSSIPEHAQNILITDGDTVDNSSGAYIRYNKHGKPVMAYGSKKEVVAWMPFPKPPKQY